MKIYAPSVRSVIVCSDSLDIFYNLLAHNFLCIFSIDGSEADSGLTALECGQSLMMVARSCPDTFRSSVGSLSEQHRTHLQSVMRSAMRHTTNNSNQEQGHGQGKVTTTTSSHFNGCEGITNNANIESSNMISNEANTNSSVGTQILGTIYRDNNIQQLSSTIPPVPGPQTLGLKFDMSKFKNSASASAAVLKPMGTFTRRTIVREMSGSFSGSSKSIEGGTGVDGMGGNDKNRNGDGDGDGEEGDENGGEKEGESRDGYNTNISNGGDSP